MKNKILVTVCFCIVCVFALNSGTFAGVYNFSVVPTRDQDKYVIIEKNQTVAFYSSPSDFEGSIEYYWSLPGTSIGFSTDQSPGLVTYNTTGEGQVNYATLDIDHVDENGQPCPNPTVTVAKVVVLKVELEEIHIAGGGSNAVAVSGTNVELKTPDVYFLGEARISPSSSVVTNKLNNRLKIKLVQAGRGYAEKYCKVPPPNGWIQSTGNTYVNDGDSSIGTGILAGVIGGATYDDAPRISGITSEDYRLVQKADFKVYLQYQFDAGDWKTIGLRTWSIDSDAAEGSGGWVGNAVATIGPAEVPSTETPPAAPPTMNSLPYYSY